MKSKSRGTWARIAVATAAVATIGVSIVGASASCSSGSGGISANGVTLSAVSYCDKREARSKSCAGDTGVAFDAGPYNRDSCTKDYNCAAAVQKNPDGYLSCRSNPDCSAKTSDDNCLAQGASAVPAGSVPLTDVCAKKYAACKSAGGKSFDDGTCPILPTFVQPLLDRLGTCFDKPCDQVKDCLSSTYAAFSPDCK